MTRNNPHNIGYWYQPKIERLPYDVLWEQWRKAWEENQKFQTEYQSQMKRGWQPLPVEAIEKFEELKIITP